MENEYRSNPGITLHKKFRHVNDSRLISLYRIVYPKINTIFHKKSTMSCLLHS